jgi:formylmethanofuran dehydrogenase subunit E
MLSMDIKDREDGSGDIRDGDIRDGDIRDGDIRDGDIRDGDTRARDVRDKGIRNGDVRDIDLAGIPQMMQNPRLSIEEMIQNQDLKGLIEKAAELHGHLCSFVTMGVIAGCLAVRKLGEESTDGMERITCIIECNNCFSDGVQITTGCTFGNNALIYRDLGKNAFTLIKRGGKALRICVRPEVREIIDTLQEKIYPGSQELFDKVVTRRSGTGKEGELLKKLFLRSSYDLLTIPQGKLLDVHEVQVESEKYAPIFRSCTCALCGEKIMETRARVQNEKIVCIPCSHDSFFQLDGAGISQKRGGRS